MPDEIFHVTPDFAVADMDIFSLTREKDHRHSYRNGRIKHGFIYIAQGAICNTFFKILKLSLSPKTREP